MNAKELIIAIKTVFEGKGAAEAQKQLSETQKKSEGAAGGLNSLGKSAGSFNSAMEKVNRAMAGFGMLALVQNILRLIQTFKDAKKAQEDMLNAVATDNAVAEIGKIKIAYDSLKESVSAANADIQATRTHMDDLTAAERRMAAASLSMSEEKEIGALDFNDPLYKEKESQVRARYGKMRAESSSKNSVDDVAQREANLRGDISRIESRMAERDQVIKDSLAAAQDYSGRAAASTAKSVKEQNAWSPFGRGRNWIGAQRTGIEQYAGYSSAFSTQAADALKTAASAKKDQATDSSLIKSAEDQLTVLKKLREASSAEGTVGIVAAGRTSSMASFGLEKARQDIIAEDEKARQKEARLLELEAEAGRLESERDAIPGRIGAARGRAAAARTAAENFRPGLAWDSGGRIAGRPEVERAAGQAAREAEQLNLTLAARLNEISRSLKAVNDRIRSEREAD